MDAGCAADAPGCMHAGVQFALPRDAGVRGALEGVARVGRHRFKARVTRGCRCRGDMERAGGLSAGVSHFVFGKGSFGHRHLVRQHGPGLGRHRLQSALPVERGPVTNEAHFPKKESAPLIVHTVSGYVANQR